MYTLCLSGGGFRATLFHLGVVRRLIQLDLFDKIKRINSVSGGSIAAGVIMREYTVTGKFKSVEDFDKRVIIPVIDFIQKSPKQNIYRLIPLQKSPRRFQKVLDKYLYKDMLFSELTKDIEWVCYATSLNTMLAWKFSQTSIGDSETGYTVPSTEDKISCGVSASACFPPLFKPVQFSTKNKTFKYKYLRGNKVDATNTSPPKEVLLLDGGIYDNLGSESVFHKNSNFIISDASAVADIWGHENPSQYQRLKRVIDVAMDQNTKLRRRLLFEKLSKLETSILIETAKELSTYTAKEIGDQPSPTPVDKMPKYEIPPYDIERKIGLIRTDLNAFHDLEIQLLIWNGMVKIDAAIKRWVPSLISSRYWEDIPTLKMDSEEIRKSEEILTKGKDMKFIFESHKELHFKEELRNNITKKL